MIDQSIDYLNSLQQSKTLNEMDQHYTALINQLGFDKFTYTYYHHDSSIVHHLSPKSMKSWHEHFQFANYEAIDPIGHQVKKSFIPILWDLQTAWKDARAQAKKMFSEAIDYGLSQGASIPIHGPNGFEAIQVIQHPNLITKFAQEPGLKLLLQQLAIHYHHGVRTHQTMTHTLLTKREIECLRLTEQRLTAKKIAEVLCITPRTVIFHMENINRKLSTPNKFHAVYVAKKLGLLV